MKIGESRVNFLNSLTTCGVLIRLIDLLTLGTLKSVGLIPGTGTLPLNLLMHLHNIEVLITTGLYRRYTASCELLNIRCFVKQGGL
jgi:hypothetical protein